MTTRDHARHGSGEGRLRFGIGDRDEAVVPAGPSLPDRLAAARERKGVDLIRAERDTKIRVRYLSALERGDYRDLPGAVYTKGFLRNYAIYLGLDPEDVLRQWRRERGDQSGSAEPAIVPPRPIEAPARPLNFSPTVIVAAFMTAGVVLFGIYLSAQLLRYAKPPELEVTNPAQAVLEVDESATTYRLAGRATAGSVVTVKSAGHADQTVTALASGEWGVQVDLRRGQNLFDITARNPETGKEAETPRRVVITVPYLVFEAPTLTVSNPVEGTTYENGAIRVEGTTTNAKTVTVTSRFLGAVGSTPAPATPAPSGQPTAAPSLAPSSAPGPSPAPTSPAGGTTVDVAADGTFSLPLELTAGRWEITITATSEQGKSASLARQVTVAYKGVNLVVTIKGGPAWVKVWVDGKLSGPQGGQVYQAGKTITFTGNTSIEVRTGSSGSTYFTLNGVTVGTLGKAGVPETWLFAPPADPVRTQRQ